MNLPDFLHEDPDGVIRLRGSRLRLIDIANRYEEGLSAEGIYEYYDTVSLALVYKVIAYYLENEKEVRGLATSDRQSMESLALRTPSGPSLAELRRRIKVREETAVK